MAIKMENVTVVLVIIAIITSASTLYYGFTVVSDLSKLTGSVADLAGSVADLATALADFENTTAADLEAIADRVTEIEGTLAPTITVVGPWAGAEMDNFLPVLERFEALSGINVKYTVFRAENLAPILPAQFAAGAVQGDVIFMWGWWIAEQGEAGHVLEVTDLVDAADFLPGTYVPVNVTGKIYGGAYTAKIKPGFWYRKSKFNAWGITPPADNATWAEFLAFLNAVAAKTTTGIPIASGDSDGWPLTDIVDHFLITFGGPQLQKDLIAGTVDWNSIEVKSIFETYLVPLLQGNFSDPLEWIPAIDLWWDGDYGLYFMGSWITGMVDNATDLGIVPLPNSTGLVPVPDYFFIPKYTKNLEAAKELFSFLISEEAQRVQVAQGGHVATNVKVSLDSYPAVDAMVANLTVGKELLLDLDDTLGDPFQSTFWDQLRLLWVQPAKLDEVLDAIQAVAP